MYIKGLHFLFLARLYFSHNINMCKRNGPPTKYGVEPVGGYYYCPIPGCPKRYTQTGNLNRHIGQAHPDNFLEEYGPMVIEELDGYYLCPIEGCDVKHKHRNSMYQHIIVHKNGEFKCDFPGCEKTFQTQSGLYWHTPTHTGTRFKCSFPGCPKHYASINKARQHERDEHTNVRKHVCEEQYPDGSVCGDLFKTADGLRKHKLQVKHTPEETRGYYEKKTKAVLRAAGIKLEGHVTIPKGTYKANGQPIYIYVDDLVLPTHPKGPVIGVEFDEFQHNSPYWPGSYDEEDELYRYLLFVDWVRSHPDLKDHPIIFLRYNPNGSYWVNGVLKETPTEEREKELVDTILSLSSPSYLQTEPIVLGYMYYDYDNGGLLVQDNMFFDKQSFPPIYAQL